MGENYHQTIEFVVDKGDELFKRLETQAERYGMTVEEMVGAVGTLGLYHHISNNLAMFERRSPQSGAADDTAG